MKMLNSMLAVPASWDLQQLPDGSGRVRHEEPGGQVLLAYCELLPGVVLTDIDLSCPVLPASNLMAPSIATINWCTAGRCEVDFGVAGSMVVGERTLCLSSALAQSFAYPTGFYRGFEYFIGVDHIDADGWTLLEALGLDKETVCAALMPDDLGINLVPSGALEATVLSIEAELASEAPRRSWLLLETCRLISLLVSSDLREARVAGSYLQRSQRDMAQVVYQHIVESNALSVDLAPLSEHFGVSEASLRSYFARVYGESPAAFARARILGEAARQLVDTDRSVADISQSCGYANPSKFSAAFRRAYDMNPLEYRRRSRL